MFRLASLVGIACFALAACALGRLSSRSQPAAGTTNDPENELRRLHTRLIRLPGKGYHAQFSLN